MSEPKKMDSRLRGNDEEKADPAEGERGKKVPRWTIPFLRALERTGNARASAADAGIDYTTAYARRRTHPDFASNWAWVLCAHAEAVEREKEGELEALRSGPLHHPADGPPPRSGEDFAVSAGQLKRTGHDRWGKRKQEAFLAELAATGNFRQASEAVGISYEAVRKRRRRDPSLEKACKAAIEACRARIPEFLAGATAATFDPDAIADSGTNPFPKVTVAEAIKIAQLHGGPKAAPAGEFEDDPDYDYEADIASIREGLVQKLQALRRRNRPELIARGWSYDESWDREIPPGWAKTDDWRPMEPEDMEY